MTSARPVAAQETLALPDLRAGVELRVACAHNPRFALLGPGQIDAVLRHASAAVREHFQVELRFTPAQTLPLAELFAQIPPAQRAKAEALRIDPSTDPAAQEPLARGLLRDMRAMGDLAAQRRFAQPHLLTQPVGPGDLAFARAVVATQHRLLVHWAQSRAADGQPLLQTGPGADRFNEYTYWSALGAGPMAFDVVLTNQLIASAEKEENSVHSALRGGVSNGITTQAKGARFGLYTVVSSHPFFDNSPHTLALRAGAPATEAGAVRQMGLLLAHEIGHLLLHLGHPFGNPACVMAPPERLEFTRWLQGLDAAKCPLASSPANTPGAVQFTAPQRMFQ